MARRPDERVNWISSIPFLAFHLSPLALLLTGVSWTAILLLVGTFWIRMFFITGGYHRYFAHRTYRLARVPQFLMALGGSTALQKGPLWWAGHHRDHHRFSDREQDVHSPQKGFWWSHVGWILCDKFSATPTDRIRDFDQYPELRFINRHDWIAPAGLGVVCYLAGGWSGLVLGFFVSTILLWHATFFVNSLAHVMGRRRYATEDTSRNSVLIAVLTMGEGWHNNHHHAPRSSRNGFFWWEWDPTYYVLRGMSWLGIAHDLIRPSAAVLAADRVRNGNLDIGMFRAKWAKATRVVAAAGTQAGEAITDRRHALDDLLSSSLDSATALAEAVRRREREALRET